MTNSAPDKVLQGQHCGLILAEYLRVFDEKS